MIDPAEIYGIAYACPFYCRIETCPLNEMDSLTFKKKVAYIKLMGNDRIFSILMHHRTCARGRAI